MVLFIRIYTNGGSVCRRHVARSLSTSSTNNAEQSSSSVDQVKQTKDQLAVFKGKKFPDFEAAYRKRGTGGRSSFNGICATIFGTHSTIGSTLLARLGNSGTQMVVPYRGAGYNEHLTRISGDLGHMFYTPFNLKDEDSLRRAMEYSNVVINLIGKINETKNFSFDDVHVHGPRRMARIARELGVKKFIHISAMNASPNPKPVVLKNGSNFLRSKYYGELAVLEEFPEAIIIRPSEILGERDNFINHYTSMQRARWTRSMPIWDYYYGVEKQPVMVPDLVDAIERAIYNDSANGKIFQGVGPYRYDMAELIEYIRACGGQGWKYDNCRTSNLRYDIIMRAAITWAETIQKYPFCTWELIERHSTSDYIDPKLPLIADLGVKFVTPEVYIENMASYRPRHHFVEIPYESMEIHDLPRRLNEVV